MCRLLKDLCIDEAIFKLVGKPTNHYFQAMMMHAPVVLDCVALFISEHPVSSTFCTQLLLLYVNTINLTIHVLYKNSSCHAIFSN